MARPISKETIERVNKLCREELKQILCEKCKRRIHLLKRVNIKLYTVVTNKKLECNYTDGLAHTNKTYIKITKKDYEYITDLTEKNDSDFVEKDGALYTFGNYRKKYALIPYNE